MDYSHIKITDPEIYAAMQSELSRQRDHIELIASENFVSPAVMEAMGSHLTNKYAEGYPAARYYGGCEYVDVVETLARDRAVRLFGADHANVQPHSGSQANVAVYLALLKPGDTILGMDLSHGGHLTHGSKASISGKYFNASFYWVNLETELIDYDLVREAALKTRRKLIIAGASAYPRFIDFAKFREIADEVGAYLMVDMAHVAGLVAAGLHKFLCGLKEHALFPGTQGGPLMHVIAAKAVCFKEAHSPEFKEYQKQIVSNCKALADALKEGGVRLVSDGTDNHMILADVYSMGRTGAEVIWYLISVSAALMAASS